MRVVITGANGFVGRALCAEAVGRGIAVRGVTRTASVLPDGVEGVVIDSIDDRTDWHDTLVACDVVIHLAARVHVMRDDASDPLSEFRLTNTAGTEHLARCAAASGVKRLVYVSSIGVNGVFTSGDGRFSEENTPSPHNAYAVSKWEAEQILRSVQHETGLEIVVVRPPLVYGARAPGNFEQLTRAVVRGIPLPLALVNNRRDLVYVGNLVDALLVCAAHPSAAGQTYLLSDGEPVSTPELLRRMSEAFRVPLRLFPAPLGLLRIGAKLAGKSAQLDRVIGSLQVDCRKICCDLNWKPPYTLQQGLQITADFTKIGIK
jgi:nucleoside-diphosphate-sugar epimerase